MLVILLTKVLSLSMCSYCLLFKLLDEPFQIVILNGLQLNIVSLRESAIIVVANLGWSYVLWIQ